MDLLDVAITAAKKGGEAVLRHFETSVERRVKTDKSFVTAADTEAESVILKEIKNAFPNHSILSEESGAEKQHSPYEWIIDPLDGTANFVNGIPLFAVSIAILKNGAPVAGVVYQPVGHSLYTAEKGKGTCWNGKQVKVSDGDKEHAMITFAPGKREKKRLNALFGAAEQFVKSKRYLGCAALDLAYVARGGTEGVFFLGLNKWDYAAGVLLVQEAGGKITDFSGAPWVFGSSDFFVASNEEAHNDLLKLAATIS
ncbi:MAG TPA: inositol monophosphatase [Candidatus Taylorbacteria bacterium]|nr:MAG: Inositol monophosphatase [Parcubacteria group bacterium GW2011_GWA2_47_64]KKU97011.1 MAG: Inositol monophosphatase [Parcubacteria group bacterium GW2011_GWC2_48_17]HBV00994.1 inositol monophosphatase [Candidatus Taylorbacteria bacterium]